MGQLTQTTAQVQVILDDADAANVGKTSLTDGSDTTSVAFKKSGFYSLQGSSANAPSTDRAVLISAVRDTAATGEIRYGQIAITESNGLWWNRDDGGSLGTWYEAVTTASAQTLTNKTLTSPILTTPQINDSAADHQYIFAGSDLTADRTVTLPLLTGDDTFVFAAHTQTLTNKTLTTPTVSGLTLSDASIIFEGATANDHETTLTVTDPTADRTITLPDATDTLVGRATTDTLTNKTLTSPIASGLSLSDASIVFEGATANDHETTLTVTDPTADRTITLPDATDTLVGLATTDTLTNKTLTSPVFNTGVSGTAVLDEDDFTGASATKLATSESIKAYVDSQVGSFDTLSEVLAAGNTTGSNDIAVDTTQKVQFRDTAIYINSSADGQLDIVSDTTVQIDSGGTITLDADTDGQVAFKDGGTQYGLISKAVNNLILKSSVVDGDVIIQGTDSGGTVTAATFDMSNSGAATFGGAVTADAGISVDNININGTTIALSSGDLTLDVAEDIILDADGGDFKFRDGGAGFFTISNSSLDTVLKTEQSNEDFIIKGNDGGSEITALTLDMSEAGAATFNAGATFGGNVDVTGTVTSDGLTVDGDAIIKSAGVNNTPADLSLWHTDVSIVSGDDLAVISAEGSDSGGSAPYQGAKILFDAAANWDTGSSNYYATNIKFFTQDNSGTDTIAAGPRMTITSSGSVGIGVSDGDVTGDGTAARTYVGIIGTANRGRLNIGSTASNGADAGTLVFTNGTNSLADLTVDTTAGVQNTGTLYINGTRSIKIQAASADEVVFNEGSTSSDFRVESDGNANMLFVDGGNNKVGIGVVPAEGALTIKSAGNTYATSALILEDVDSTTRTYITHVNDALAISNNSSRDDLLLDSSGNLKVVTGALQLNDVAQSIDFMQSGAINFDSNNDQTGRILTIGSNRANGASGGTTNVTFDETGGTTFNEGGVDADFRVESDSNDHMFFVDAGLNGIGIGTSSVFDHQQGSAFDMSYDGTIWAGTNYWAGGLRTGTTFYTTTAGDKFKHTDRQANQIYYNSQGGSIHFYSAASGTAGDVISWREMAEFDRDEVVFNNGGVDQDFRVESDTNTNAIFVDSGAAVTYIGKNTGSLSDTGFYFAHNTGNAEFTGNGSTDPLRINRLSSDGNLINFYQDTSAEGNISVSGSTVSYNGFAGRHESSGIATTTAKGTVVSTIDELDEYLSGPRQGQTRADHAKVKMSDTVGDARVYGVVDDFTDEGKVNVISVGIGSIKVTGACAGGDLLESNGDGTAKVQTDDIIRSKTIGKVTIGNSNTGVKLVSCVLYCG